MDERTEEMTFFPARQRPCISQPARQADTKYRVFVKRLFNKKWLGGLPRFLIRRHRINIRLLRNACRLFWEQYISIDNKLSQSKQITILGNVKIGRFGVQEVFAGLLCVCVITGRLKKLCTFLNLLYTILCLLIN